MINKPDLIEWLQKTKIRYSSNFPVFLNVYLNGDVEVVRRLSAETIETETIYMGTDMDEAINLYNYYVDLYDRG